jgi:hypothetical protein
VDTGLPLLLSAVLRSVGIQEQYSMAVRLVLVLVLVLVGATQADHKYTQ